MSIKFVKTHEEAKLPTRGSSEAACFDLYSVEHVIINSGSTQVIDTGLKVAHIPKGYRLAVYSRSGLAAKNSISVLNAPGVIDSDYRGNIKVILHNNKPGFLKNELFVVNVGDRIAQIALEKIEENVIFTFVTDADVVSSERGAGGLGSTGIN